MKKKTKKIHEFLPAVWDPPAVRLRFFQRKFGLLLYRYRCIFRNSDEENDEDNEERDIDDENADEDVKDEEDED